ncbi:hypothetical protein EVA_17450, partial [gut metagenome]
IMSIDGNKKEISMKIPILYIVIPCYNEQEVLPITAPLFYKKSSHSPKEDASHLRAESFL